MPVAGNHNGGHHMPIVLKTLLLQAGIIAVSICVGATAMYAWQAGAGKIDPQAVSRGSMSTFIQQLHNNAHIDNLPVQVIDGYL
jgi:hypothetical protein